MLFRSTEKANLDALLRESPIFIGAPFELTIDWHEDERSGGSDFKTWAGQQSLIGIAQGMQGLLRSALVGLNDIEQCLNVVAPGTSLPFNFDAL